MQTEVGEAFEPEGGGSSSMPHKRNPVGSAAVLAAAARVPALVSVMLSAMAQAHERGLGDWHAEWETLPEICTLAGGAVDRTAHILGGLVVDPARMRANLEATRGQIYAGGVAMALAPHLGASAARRRVEAACRSALESGRHLREVVAEDAEARAHLSDRDLDRLFDPEHAIGAAEAQIDRVLRSRQ